MRISMPLPDFLKFACCAIFLLLFEVIDAQNYPVRHFGVEDGLPHSNVYRISQDKRGFLWLCTDNGLGKFDGQKFTNYSVSEGLSESIVMSLYERPSGEKLLSTYGGGIDIMRENNISAMRYGKVPLPQCVIYAMESHGSTWIIDKSGNLRQIHDGRQEIYPLSGKGVLMPVRRMLQLQNGDMLFCGSAGLHRWNPKYGLYPYVRDKIHDVVYACVEQRDGTLWLAMKGHIIQLKGETVVKDIKLKADNEVSDILPDHNGNVWVAVSGYGLLLVKDNEQIDMNPRLGLGNVIINDLFEDKTGNVWIATHGAGLYCVLSLSIINYPVQERTVNSYVKALCSVNGNVFIGSIGTLSKFDGKKLLPLKSSLVSSVDYIYFIKSLGNNLLIGSSKGIFFKNIRSGEEKFLSNSQPEQYLGALAYYEDHRGIQWLTRFSGVCQIKNGRLYPIDSVPLFNKRRVNDIEEDASGNLFFATDSGLIVFNGKGFRQIFPGSVASANNIKAICRGKDGSIWLATFGGLFNMHYGSLRHFTQDDGLSSNQCTSLVCDSNGNIWIGTFGGLSEFDGRQFRMYDYDAGLVSNEVLSLCEDDKHNLWVGTVNGLSEMRQDMINTAFTQPEVFITSVKEGSNIVYYPRDLKLGQGSRTLHIEFAAPYFPPAKVEYQYKLQGQEDSWHTTASNAVDLSLPAGDYTFMVRARRIGYSWSPLKAELHMLIPKPFWQTPAGIVLIVLLAVLCIYLPVKYIIISRERKAREKAVLFAKMLHLKQQALTALINPHFIFNCLNSIQSYIYRNDKEAANIYLAEFASLVRMTLDNAMHSFIILDEEIRRLQLYLKMEGLRFNNKLRYSIHVNPAVDVNNIKIPNMILQPYIENAILHGIMPKKEGGAINIDICKDDTDNDLLIRITDNGVGFDRSKRIRSAKSARLHHSLGMQLTEDRLKLLKEITNNAYSVSVSSGKNEKGEDEGTVIIIKLSCSTADALKVIEQDEAF